MTINDVKNMNVDRFCVVIKVALETGYITGQEAIELIKEFWRMLK